MRSLGRKETNLNGPVPIAALPLLKSSVVAFAATVWSTMKTCVMSIGSRGYTVLVCRRMVCGSTTSMLAIDFV